MNGEAVPVDIIFDTTEENYGDYLDGGVGNYTLTASGRQDTLYGGKGNDKINGACAKDYLIGGNGNDKLYGGDSSDMLSGGTGADNIGFIFPDQGIDTITDFVVASDTITVDAYGFGGGLTKGAAITAAQFRIGATATDEARPLLIFIPYVRSRKQGTRLRSGSESPLD